MTDWITVAVASRKAEVSDRTIRNWIAKGKITAKKERGKWMIDPASLSEIGKNDFQSVGKSETEATISVPLERYEALITRLAQLESENRQYRLMLESSEDKQERVQRSWWKRLLKRKKTN